MPNLTTHFETLGLSLPLLTTRWFMCIFALVLPVETTLHIWDQVLVYSAVSLCSFNPPYRIHPLLPHHTASARGFFLVYGVVVVQCINNITHWILCPRWHSYEQRNRSCNLGDEKYGNFNEKIRPLPKFSIVPQLF